MGAPAALGAGVEIVEQADRGHDGDAGLDAPRRADSCERHRQAEHGEPVARGG